MRSVRRWTELIFPWELDYAAAVFEDPGVNFLACFRRDALWDWAYAEVSCYLMRRWEYSLDISWTD